MTTASEAIERLLNTPSKRPTKIEAQRILRRSGILDKNNKITPGYKDIVKKAENK